MEIIAILVLIIPVSIYLLIQTKKNSTNEKASTNQVQINKPITPEEAKEPEITEYIDYSNSYQKRYLLTKNEWYEYKKLKIEAANLGLQVCPKVRLLDLIEPRRGPGYMSYLGRIQSKHVDFVLCDTNLYVKAIVELDDNSHDRQDRQERDDFVNQVLRSVGYTVIHTRSITENTLDCLKPKEPTA